MPKVDIDLVKMVLQRNELDVGQVAQILEDINVELANQVDEDKPPPVKKQFTILVSDPNDVLEGQDLVAWVLQIPEEDSPALTEERLVQSAYAFNQTPKGRRMPVKKIGETCEVVPARILKENNIWVKTKEPVLVLRTSNDFPWDEKGGE